jgi:mutator protein MutT
MKMDSQKLVVKTEVVNKWKSALARDKDKADVKLIEDFQAATPKVETTLLILRRNNQILLAKKKRGFGKGKYNGVGGKVNAGETPEQAMVREAEEEIFVTPTKYEKVGVMDFLEYDKGVRKNIFFHLYLATAWHGEPQESDEMKPKWFEIDKIPYEKMFPDDKHWLPRVLAGEKIDGHFEFDEGWNLILWEIREAK